MRFHGKTIHFSGNIILSQVKETGFGLVSGKVDQVVFEVEYLSRTHCMTIFILNLSLFITKKIDLIIQFIPRILANEIFESVRFSTFKKKMLDATDYHS